MRIIAAIDIIDGKCVRLSRGDYSTKREYSASPVETAKIFEEAGLKHLHLVDLDGARTGKPVNINILNEIASKTSLTIDYSGGIRSITDIRRVFDSGANQVSAGSIAVTEPNLFMFWLSRYGPDRIILGADCRDRLVATHGWRENGGIDIIRFIKSYASLGINNVICTDITRDGMLSGPSTELYREILSVTSVNLTASGGIYRLKDLKVLKNLGCQGAIIGKALYEGKIKLKQLGDYVEKEDNTLS